MAERKDRQPDEEPPEALIVVIGILSACLAVQVWHRLFV